MNWVIAVVRSFGPAWSGLCWALKTQRNLQVHAVATVLTLILGFWLEIAPFEWLAVISAIGIVWVAELLNTSIEVLADRVSVEREEAIRRVKDVAAAAVLMAAVSATAVAIVVFAPRIVRLFENVPAPP